MEGSVLLHSIADFNLTQWKCGVLFTASMIHMKVEDKQNLPSRISCCLERPDDKSPPQHCRNITSWGQGKEPGTHVLSIFPPQGTVFDLHSSKFIQKSEKIPYTVPTKIFVWKPHKAIGRACHRLSLTYWLAGHLDLLWIPPLKLEVTWKHVYQY